MLKFAAEIVSGLLDFVYPKVCAGCGEVIDTFLCEDCRESIIVIEPPTCRICGSPSEYFTCNECKEKQYYFDSASSAALFEGALQKVIQKFKFNGITELSGLLSELLIESYPLYFKYRKIDIAAPIPIHYKRMVERGFNQSDILGSKLCSTLDIPYSTDILSKIKHTKDQVNLSLDDRIINLQGAFRVSGKLDIKDKNILLIDDVFTTGSTINEAAKTLKEAGAMEVYAYTVGRRM
jgi:competence protein ComFC